MKQNQSMAFNGMVNGNSGGYSTRYQGTQTAGYKNPDRINVGRGPTVAGKTGDSVANPTARSGKINGGTKVPCCAAKNVGRGPTKGNQQ